MSTNKTHKPKSLGFEIPFSENMNINNLTMNLENILKITSFPLFWKVCKINENKGQTRLVTMQNGVISDPRKTKMV